MTLPPELVSAAFKLAIAALTPVAIWVSATVVGWLKAKTQGTKAGTVIEVGEHYAGIIVADLEATVKPTLIGFLSDGKITADEGAQLKALAMVRLRAMLGDHWLEVLQKVLGIYAPQVDAYLSGIIEKAVAKLGQPLDGVSVIVPGKGFSELQRVGP